MNNLARDAITDNLTDYFSRVRDIYNGPIGMLYAVEILLSDMKLHEPNFLLELQDQAWGGSRVSEYVDDLNSRILQTVKPVFQVELSAMRRWRADSFYPAEVFWLDYLSCMTGVKVSGFEPVADHALSQLERQDSVQRVTDSDRCQTIRELAAKVMRALGEVS